MTRPNFLRKRPGLAGVVTGLTLLAVTGPVAFGLAGGLAYHLRVTGWGGGPPQLWFFLGTLLWGTPLLLAGLVGWALSRRPGWERIGLSLLAASAAVAVLTLAVVAAGVVWWTIRYGGN